MRNLFDEKDKLWDQYRRFYSGDDGGWIDFESGEFKFGYGGDVKLDDRFYYYRRHVALTDSNLHISNLSTLRAELGIREFHLVDPVTGNKIPKAQVSYKGLITMAWDTDTNKVYKVGRDFHRDESQPDYLKRNSIFVDTEGQVHAPPIRFYRPHKATQADHDWVKQVTVASKMLHANEYVPDYLMYSNYKENGEIDPKLCSTMTPGEFIKSIEALDPHKRLPIIGCARANKLQIGRVEETREYLIMETK